MNLINVVSVDPGVRNLGMAIFSFNKSDGSSNLRYAALISASHKDMTVLESAADMAERVVQFMSGDPTLVVIEKPQTYGGMAAKGCDTNDLLDVSLTVGAIGALAHAKYKHKLVTVAPRAWKGTVDADVMIRRIQGKLTPDETARVKLPNAKGVQHNVWDAVGIGLAQCKRL